MPPTPQDPALIPLSIGEVFSSSFAIYRKNFAQFVLVGLIPTVAGVVVTLAVAAAALAIAIPWLLSMNGPEPGGYGLGAVGLGLLGLALVAGSVLALVAWYVSAGMISLGVVQVNRGQLPTVRSLWHDTPGLSARSLGLLGLYVVLGLVLATAIGLVTALTLRLDAWWLLLALVVVVVGLAVLMQARLGLLLQVLGIEGRGPLASVGNCWRLTAGNGARIFLALFLVQFVVNAALNVVSSVALALTGSLDPLLAAADSYQDVLRALGIAAPGLVLGTMLTTLAGVVAAPFVPIFSAVLYVDQLRRKQALAGQPLLA